MGATGRGDVCAPAPVSGHWLREARTIHPAPVAPGIGGWRTKLYAIRSWCLNALWRQEKQGTTSPDPQRCILLRQMPTGRLAAPRRDPNRFQNSLSSRTDQGLLSQISHYSSHYLMRRVSTKKPTRNECCRLSRNEFCRWNN